MTQIDSLIEKAIEATKNAYIVYSNYPVGAALLTKSGKVYIGSNLENAVYSLTSCAERNAIFKAVTEGEKDWSLIAVVTRNGGFPCGACRQVMYEFNPDLPIVVAKLNGDIVQKTTVTELLPYAWGPKDFEK